MKNIGQYIKEAKKTLEAGAAGIVAFAVTYYKAMRDHGQHAYDEFRRAFPFFGEREWERFSLVGDGTLDPIFLFKSDSFIGKLLKMKDPAKAQADIFGAAYDATASMEEREANVAGIVRKINKSRSANKRRGSREILSDMIDAIVRLESLRDDGWDFMDKHGFDPAYWSDDEDSRYAEIQSDIQAMRNKVSALVKEATGKEISV